jgi:hypothetical protein
MKGNGGHASRMKRSTPNIRQAMAMEPNWKSGSIQIRSDEAAV